MKAMVDKDLCTGCELCVQTCADVFEMQDGLAVTKVDQVSAEAQDSCRQAAEDCPVEAIKFD